MDRAGKQHFVTALAPIPDSLGASVEARDQLAVQKKFFKQHRY